MKLRIMVTVFVLTVFPVVANAAVIYEQATLETTDRGAYQHFNQQLADDFIPVVSGSLQTITWKGSYYDIDNPAANESFTIQLFNDNAGLPATTPFFEVVDSASKIPSGTLLLKTLYEYSMTVSGPVLNAGTKYWINIYTNDSPNNYAGANSTDGTPEGAMRNGINPWTSLNNEIRSNHIFKLDNGEAEAATPVPTMNEWGMIIFMLLAGCVSVYYLRKDKSVFSAE